MTDTCRDGTTLCRDYPPSRHNRQPCLHCMEAATGLQKGFLGTRSHVLLDVYGCRRQRANVLMHNLVSTSTSSGSNKIQHLRKCKLIKANSQEKQASTGRGMSHNFGLEVERMFDTLNGKGNKVQKGWTVFGETSMSYLARGASSIDPLSPPLAPQSSHWDPSPLPELKDPRETHPPMPRKAPISRPQ